MNDSFCFIVNTISNKGRAGRYFSQNMAKVKNRFPECRIIMIEEEERIDEHAAKAAQECRYTIAVGGDRKTCCKRSIGNRSCFRGLADRQWQRFCQKPGDGSPV